MFTFFAHRATHECDLAVERGGCVAHLLHAMDVRSEARDHDAALAPAAKDLLQMRGPTPDSEGEKPAAVRVGRVAAQQQQPVAPQLPPGRDTSAGSPSTGVWSNL